jgi:hypothetical protein
MRLLASVFLMFLSIGNLKADVVIGNSLAANGSGGFSANSGTVYALNFSTPASGSWKLDKITLFGDTDPLVGVANQTFSNNGQGALTFQLLSGGGISLGLTDTVVLGSTRYNSSSQITVDFTTGGASSISNFIMNQGTQYQLKMSYSVVNFTGQNVGTTPTSSNGFTSIDWQTVTRTGLSTTSPFQFQLNGTAVPEPGTLLLGAIAAASSGTGFWWKRRRKHLKK